MPSRPSWWSRARSWQSVCLLPAAAAYRGLSGLRAAVSRPYRCGRPVICVGNAVAGGAGKTPCVLFLVKMLQEEGKRAVVVAKGYGGRITRPEVVDPDVHTAEDVGDEALLLARHAPVYIGKSRRAALALAASSCPDVILMDDGMQNPGVHKDMLILVESPAYVPKNSRLIPSGPYREKREAALARADAVFFLHYRREDVPEQETETYHFYQAPNLSALDAELPYVAFAGVGTPQKFFDTLAYAGLRVEETHPFPDHHRYSRADLDGLLLAAAARRSALICTEKDWVRLPSEFRRYARFLPVALRLGEEETRRLSARLAEALSPKEPA
jgi:tetraacyldisaccharide 4'-kinase